MDRPDLALTRGLAAKDTEELAHVLRETLIKAEAARKRAAELSDSAKHAAAGARTYERVARKIQRLMRRTDKQIAERPRAQKRTRS